jgi:hypothetical protein
VGGRKTAEDRCGGGVILKANYLVDYGL